MRPIALALLAAAACHRQPAAPATAPGAPVATVVFSASLAGTLEPCGCSPDQRGGIYRAAAYLARVRAEAPGALYLDGGDVLFEGAHVAPEKAAQAKLKAETLAQEVKLERLDGFAVGERDLAAGEAFLSAQALPAIATTKLFDVGALKVGVAAAADEAAIASAGKALRGNGARVCLLLAHVSIAKAQGLAAAAKAAGFDLVLAGHADEPQDAENRAVGEGPVPVFGVEGRGQSLLRLDVTAPAGAPPGAVLLLGDAGKQETLTELDARLAAEREKAKTAAPQLKALLDKHLKDLAARRAAAEAAHESVPTDRVSVKATFVRLEKDLASSDEAKKLIAAYDARVSAQNLAAAKTEPDRCPADPSEPKGPQFVGAESCKECHATEYDFWKKTPHASAYAKLEGVNKQYSLDCVGCHVVGWLRPGGPCRIDKPKALGLADVQCESCHGAGSAHADSGGGEAVPLAGPEKSRCIVCHESQNSPHFEFASYLKKVVGPGHQRSPARP